MTDTPKHPGGRPVLRQKGYKRYDLPGPPEAAAKLLRAAEAKGGSRSMFLGRLAVMGLELAEKAGRLDI